MQPIEKRLLEHFKCNQWTLSTAESCTAGAIAALLSQAPGAGDYLMGGIVAYQITIKCNVLNIPKSLIDTMDVVSAEVAEQMALGVINLMQSDFGLSITGVAGPTRGDSSKPVGTVYIGIAKKDAWVKSFHFFLEGDRRQIIDQAVLKSLETLLSVTQETRSSKEDNLS